MAPSTMAVTGTFEGPDGALSQGTGTVTFTPVLPAGFFGPQPRFSNGGYCIVNRPVTVTLVAGQIPGGFALDRCSGGYSVVENVDGLQQYGPYTIPDQAGPVDLSSFH